MSEAIERASCQSCGEITLWVGDRRCAYCDGELRKIGVVFARRPNRSDNNRSRWNDLRRQEVIEAYARGNDIPEIALAIFEAMGYKSAEVARASIRQEFKRMGVGLRAPRNCATEGCQRDAITRSKHCFSHAPEVAEQRAEILKNTRAGIANYPRKGEEHHKAKLWDEEVLAIRASGEPTEVLARRYGVTDSTVRKIRAGTAWAHVGAAA